MASLFKPPESVKQNSKSPKLTLPSALQHNTRPKSSSAKLNTHLSSSNLLHSTASPLLPSPSQSSTTSVGSSAGSDVTTAHGQNYNYQSTNSFTSQLLHAQPYTVSSSSTLSASSTVSLKKRPVPPPLPPLSVSQANSEASLKSNDVSDSLKKLSINPISDGNPIMTGTAIEPEEATDTYPATLLSSYGDQSSSSNASPIKSPQVQTLSNKDIDQLEEQDWKTIHAENEIITLGILGEGAFGSVAKCRLKKGSKIFALKTINTLNTDPDYQKQIFRELQFNKSFKSEHIVRYYGMFADEEKSSIFIAMEYMGGRSLDAIYKNLLSRDGRISEKILGKIAESVLRGLSYLHEKKVIHRDIKPQNILFDELGHIKLCDFGVSGEAVNSLATTFTGTSYYMAPERIQGQPYSVTCDVWSLGLTLLEVAQAKFPFATDKISANIAPIELLMVILTFTPELKDEPELNIYWSKAFKSFMEYCLKKEPKERPSPRQMIQHPWLQGQMKKKVNMEKFIIKCWRES